jgi:D-3-phosphoglycerate dehydrogenase
MHPWRIILTDGLDEVGVSILEKEAEVVKRSGISAEDLKMELKDYDAVIIRSRTKMARNLIECGSRLKVIGRAGVGVDNIDLDAAKDKGIVVVNAPSATTESVAELTLGLIFALAREIPRADATMKRGEWAKKEFMGTELYGKTLGIIGFGRIGSTVGQMAAAMGMRINACCDFTIPETIRIIGGELLMMDEIIERSDFIAVHTPLTEKTRNMMDASMIERMKDGVYIICTARGGIIDEAALLAALNSNKVAGAALDVFEKEPPENMDLVKHPRVIASPHIAGQTNEAQRRASVDISREVLAALKSEKLHWQVT